jgi:hypothetical protein
VLSEDTFNRDSVRTVFVDQRRNGITDGEESLFELELWRSADYPDVDECRLSRVRDIHDPYPTAGEPWVDAENPKSHSLVFVQLCLNVCRNVKVGENVLNVIGIFERIDESEHLACSLGVDLDGEVGHEFSFG